MNSEEAIQYFNDEIRLCRAAPSINGCQMTEDWQRTIDACEIAVAAIRKVHELEQEAGRLRAELAAYKETGLEPDVCANYRKFEDEAISKGVPFKRIVELMNAEQDGRLVVLLCKVGDRVWYITSSAEICEAEVIGIWLNVYTNPQMWLEIKYHSKFTGECEHKSRIDLMLGKIIFLSREEAEAALAGKGGDG